VINVNRYILSSQGHASPINDLVGLLEFTEDELLKAQKGLDAAGITLPNFKNVSKELAKEPTPEPSPPPETEEERIDRELGDCEEDVVGLQACVRGWLKRESLRRLKGRLRRAERYVVQVQASARGGFVRSVFGEHLRGYQESVKLALMVRFLSIWMSNCRFKLV
jgi:Ras GTPase-activating-like protein IQGAP2/3